MNQLRSSYELPSNFCGRGSRTSEAHAARAVSFWSCLKITSPIQPFFSIANAFGQQLTTPADSPPRCRSP